MDEADQAPPEPHTERRRTPMPYASGPLVDVCRRVSETILFRSALAIMVPMALQVPDPTPDQEQW